LVVIKTSMTNLAWSWQERLRVCSNLPVLVQQLLIVVKFSEFWSAWSWQERLRVSSNLIVLVQQLLIVVKTSMTNLAWSWQERLRVSADLPVLIQQLSVIVSGTDLINLSKVHPFGRSCGPGWVLKCWSVEFKNLLSDFLVRAEVASSSIWGEVDKPAYLTSNSGLWGNYLL
jgi:hypothetical protein